jgi:immunity protein, SdpI family
MSRIIFSRLNLALMAAIACVTIAGFWVLPADQQLPLHWNWHGVVDNWGSRERVLLLLPMAAVAMTIFFWTFGRWILRLDELHGGRQFALGLSSTLAILFVLQLMIVRYGLGYPVEVPRAIAFVAALFFIAIGNVLPKMQPKARRFSWPNSLDASQHRRIQRLTGGVMMVSGSGLLIASVFDVPPPWLNSGTIIAALLPAAAGIAYALLLSSARASNG